MNTYTIEAVAVWAAGAYIVLVFALFCVGIIIDAFTWLQDDRDYHTNGGWNGWDKL